MTRTNPINQSSGHSVIRLGQIARGQLTLLMPPTYIRSPKADTKRNQCWHANGVQTTTEADFGAAYLGKVKIWWK